MRKQYTSYMSALCFSCFILHSQSSVLYLPPNSSIKMKVAVTGNIYLVALIAAVSKSCFINFGDQNGHNFLEWAHKHKYVDFILSNKSTNRTTHTFLSWGALPRSMCTVCTCANLFGQLLNVPSFIRSSHVLVRSQEAFCQFTRMIDLKKTWVVRRLSIDNFVK